jgi:hypothetical protein
MSWALLGDVGGAATRTGSASGSGASSPGSGAADSSNSISIENVTPSGTRLS